MAGFELRSSRTNEGDAKLVTAALREQHSSATGHRGPSHPTVKSLINYPGEYCPFAALLMAAVCMPITVNHSVHAPDLIFQPCRCLL